MRSAKGWAPSVSAFYQVIPNLGVAIILLTVAVMLLLFPLTLKQTRSIERRCRSCSPS